ncbi:hypothetical protein M413DRAFT_415980 [Hebeloma cylindrosporum]|uniref:Uncharacterized protein n=1 Tax=Hebeloma cylindrosporum TaxID=76867 RepID=A0A0C2XNV5_HEBCY|nr:hypothetical protein M413DRAFT_415980 [Hebeloma cylindrosporum h7]
MSPNSHYSLEQELSSLDVVPIHDASDISTSSNTSPLTRSDTVMTFNTYWDRLISMPASSEGSTTFEHKSASEAPVSNALGRSDTVSSFDSTWDDHIISSSAEARNDRSFSEYSEEPVNGYGEYGLGAYLGIDDGSQMSNGEELNSDDDAATVYGDYSEFNTDCTNHVNMDSEASVAVPIACVSPSLAPSGLSTSASSAESSATSDQYMGLLTRSRKSKVEPKDVTEDAEPPQKRAKLDIPRAPTARNENSQKESTAYSIIWEGKRKHYSCNTCPNTDTRKDRMMAHVRQNHPVLNSR